MPARIPAFAQRGVLINPPEDLLPMQGVHKIDAGFVEMEYTGEEETPEPILAPSGRVYTFDQKERKAVLIYVLDINYLKLLGVAKVVGGWPP